MEERWSFGQVLPLKKWVYVALNSQMAVPWSAPGAALAAGAGWATEQLGPGSTWEDRTGNRSWGLARRALVYKAIVCATFCCEATTPTGLLLWAVQAPHVWCCWLESGRGRARLRRADSVRTCLLPVEYSVVSGFFVFGYHTDTQCIHK